MRKPRVAPRIMPAVDVSTGQQVSPDQRGRYLGGQWHFFSVADCVFEGGFARDRHSRPAAAHSNQGSNPEHPRLSKDRAGRWKTFRTTVHDWVRANQRTGPVTLKRPGEIASDVMDGPSLHPCNDRGSHHRRRGFTHRSDGNYLGLLRQENTSASSACV